MSPEVVKRKLKLLIKYLEDLKKFKDVSFEEFMANHYTIERILELLVITSSDLIFHLLTKKKEPIPSSYSSAFLRAGELRIISNELANSLAESAGMRNILVHGYEEVDYQLVYESIRQAIKDFSNFLVEVGG